MNEVIDITARQRIDSHEDLCADRYEGIKNGMADIKDALTAQAKDIKNLRGTINRYVIGLMTFGVITLMGITSYLYIELNDRNTKQLDLATEQALKKYKGYTGD